MANSIFKREKIAILGLIIIIYILVGVILFVLINKGVIEKKPPKFFYYEEKDSTDSPLLNAERFIESKMKAENGHIYLYIPINKNSTLGDKRTNSEAISYYLLWNSLSGNKNEYDKGLNFIEQKMLHPKAGYLMWRIEENGSVVSDGSNIASDADLRLLKSLFIAKDKWGDNRYDILIDKIANGIETTTMTKDNYFSPYAGVGDDGKIWKTEEVWLSYSDFETFKKLAERRKGKWIEVYNNMKNATLGAQNSVGFYNTQLTIDRKYSNSLDNGNYSINSLWIMVRSAESKDPELIESARKSLEFYKRSYSRYQMIFTSYDKFGNPTSSDDSPWVYALVGRAAINLDDFEFANEMVMKLLDYQINDQKSEFYGAFIEGTSSDLLVSQFTNQESILTLYDYFFNYDGKTNKGIFNFNERRYER